MKDFREKYPLTRRERREHVLRRMVSEPLPLLQDLLAARSESSLEIERQTGIPASVVRSVRNVGVQDQKLSSYMPLLWWLLVTDREWRRAFPELEDYREAWSTYERASA